MIFFTGTIIRFIENTSKSTRINRVNLQNNVSKLFIIILVALHIILTVLNICEGFSERSIPYLTCTVPFVGPHTSHN